MADKEWDIQVKLESDKKKQIATLREQQRNINKEIKRLKEADKDVEKIDEWKMIHDLKQEVVGRLKAVNVSWNKFVGTPDYFEYAYYVGGGTSGPKRIKTSMTKPSASDTKTDEAKMIKDAIDYRSKIVRRKKRKKSSTSTTTATDGKAAALKTGGVL